ncbi:class III lanthionine synthetase LanKC [Streptomyces griseoviridis]|uniref:tRNA A-37 threonylcarbamoyl transferase component Bud32 n=3 Tax=Streptomyces TaxID=1883 RepID=A0ABT9LMY2_STRGD|nr:MULTISPECIES: class III lanthionine synthetase LanKC [Streptomyces]MDP9684903.1 tRNA A-37 threonylcarbamoyl transferase component Bud32 [Streptomyces griseoviridis]GGS52407.1 serine/threonine protein kinase [Streptomyces niveoruber]GGT17523.1 serine/threonine protein kinase [Streptomyces griseoviridis]GGU46615.1 serine/threonine protein kinase [Streptomyces daghestanicus]GHI33621.1 serine/threonine protein kinase [Streptomyces daghestanicus]
MNKGYAVYCDADPCFYDAPHRTSARPGTGRSRYALASAPVPAGWQRNESGDWLALRPVDAALPDQGWKIHVAACLDNAESVLERVYRHCVDGGTAFKFVPSRYLLHQRNAKYADRAGSGKFITVYPADEERFERLAGELSELLAGEPGPHILSDLRLGDGPVHVRYGGFTRRNCYDADGELRPAVARPDGVLIPDLRGPVFRVPEWVTVPAFLQPHLQARSAVTVAGLPYTVESALHFSNGGGVYLGRDTRTGAQVVLKEARPHAGLAADGADAVTRLHRERQALERLSGLDCTPEVLDHLTVGEHHFLVLEYLDGKPLNTFFARRHPLIEADPDERRLAEYTDWALDVHARVERAVADVHARGVVFNDLHLFNIMVRDDGSVALLDFEAAHHVDEPGRQTVANPAFVAPADRRGVAVDRYALACLRLALFLPLTSLFALDRQKAAHLADLVAGQFPVDRAWLDAAVEEITDGAAGTSPARGASGPVVPVDPGDWPHSRESMAAAIHASATLSRTDRLFPGDIAQFATAGGGLSFGYGAAGVLYALAVSGADRDEDEEQWLLDRTKEPPSGTPSGFHDGLAGIAWTLDHLGHRDRALDLTALLLDQPLDHLAPDLHSGTAGVGLALDALAAATGDPAPRAAALRCAELTARRLTGEGPSTRPRAGLLYGAAGGALLFLRLYERTGDTGLLDLARDALRRDLARCVRGAGGALQVDEGWRTMPYLGAGSVGIGMVLDDYLAHRADEEFARARDEIVAAAQAMFYAQPGLYRGVAGMVLYLARTTATAPGTGPAAVRRQLDALSWHALSYRGRLAFPGEQMMRLSMDLSTGTAGCLLAVASAHGGPQAGLPFLPPPGTRPAGP